MCLGLVFHWGWQGSITIIFFPSLRWDLLEKFLRYETATGLVRLHWEGASVVYRHWAEFAAGPLQRCLCYVQRPRGDFTIIAEHNSERWSELVKLFYKSFRIQGTKRRAVHSGDWLLSIEGTWFISTEQSSTSKPACISTRGIGGTGALDDLANNPCSLDSVLF